MRKGRLLAIVAATATLSLAATLAYTGIASAHAQKKRFTPAPDSVVATAPKNLDLAFTEDLKSLHVQVLNTSGNALLDVTPTVRAADPAHVAIPLQTTLAAGDYTVKWDAVAADGDATSGRYIFHVTTPAAPDGVRVFVDGHEVKGAVPAQIVNGTTLVPARAMAEALGKWVDWDPDQHFVVINDGPQEHADLGIFTHPSASPAPTLQVKATANAQSGFDVQVQTTNWTWTPEKVGSAPAPNQGYARLYVDGHLATWLYGPWYHLDGLAPGPHDVRVTLNATNHAEYVLGDDADTVVAATASIVQRASGK